MDEMSPRKSVFKRWWFWFLMVIAFILISLGVFLYCYYYLWMRMSPSQVKKAETALSKGFTISDGKDDFVIIGTNQEKLNAEDNPSPYRLDWFDIKSAQVGADEKYLYYKMTFYGKSPKWAQDVNGDTILGVGTKLNIVDDSEIDIAGPGADFGYLPIVGFPVLNTYYFYEPTGIEEPEEKRFAHQGSDSKVSGGAGTDYVMGAFPMDKLQLKLGDEINLILSMEVKSDIYTHAAVDVLLGSGKQPAMIKWKVGSSDYQIVEPIKTQEQSEKK
jgi:hypothetical protein